MADTFGFSLDITGLDNALLAAQGHLTNLEKESQKTQQRMVDMFRAIATQGVDAYLQKLYDTKAAMEMVANTKLSGSNPLFKQIQDDATKSINAVNTLIDALAKASGVQAPTSSTADKERNRAIQEANNQAILNAEKARKEYEEQYRMYEKMFVQADKKHPEIIEVGNAQQQLNAVEKEMDRLIERIAKLQNEIEIFKSMESGNTLNTEDYKYIGKVSDEINKLIEQYEKLDKEQQKISKNLKDLKTSPTSYEGAMRTSGKADTYEREKKAIEVLTIARDNLSKTDADYATKLNALNEAIRKHQENLKNATLTDQERAAAEQAAIDKEVANYDKLLSKIKELEEQKAQAEQIQEELGPQKQGEDIEVTEMRNEAAESEAEAIKELQDLFDKKEDMENKHQDKLDKVKQKHRAKDLQEDKKNLEAKRKAQEHATTIRNYQQNPQSARETKSIQEQILAIKRLKEARDTLERGNNNREYEKKVRAINKELARQEQQVARLQNKSTGAFGKMTGMAGQLGDRIKAAFSVAAITGFVNKLIQVRGAMEKNQTALQIILRDKDAANEVWDKTVALAVKSPFTVNQLIGYTKQLAAYRIENDKLYDTTKRLADMSAGLGVDMSRLILAYGQVRAATYLRATEVRQFTEAGVPLLEELADYLSQVEQRTVTVGEVMERISKRGVLFKDVEAVLKRMTDEGGVFYQMQEKQSQTTWGMVSNLKDEIELMFNDIGAANGGAIKGSLSLIRTLVREWRKLLPIVTTLAGMFAAIFAGKGIIALIRMVINLTMALRGAVAVSRTLSLSMLTNPYLAVAAAIGAIAGAIIGWGEETDRLKAKLIQIDEEAFGDFTDAIETYKELAEEVKNAVKGSMEYNEALRKMKERYGEILSDELLHAEYLERTTDGYALATEAMREYYANKAIERKKDAIENEYSEDITDQQRETIEELEEYFGELKSEGRIDYTQYTQALAAIRPVMRKFVEDLKSGELTLDGYSDIATNEIFDRINEYLGSAGRDYGAEDYRKDATMAFDTIQDNANNLVRKARELNDEMGDIIGLTPDFATAADAATSAEFQTIKDRFEAFVSLMERYKALVIDFNEGNITMDAYTSLLDEIYKEMEKTSPVLFAEFRDAFGNIGYSSGFEFGRRWDIAYEEWAKSWHYSGNNNLVNQFGEQIDADAEKKLESKVTTVLNDAITDAVNTVNAQKGTNIDLDLFESVKVSNDKSYQQWLQQMEEMRDRYAGYVKTFNEGTQTQIEALKASGIDKNSSEAILAIIEMLIGAKKTTGSGRTSNIWKERIDLIEKMRKSYVDLQKTFADGDALKRVEDSYQDIFKELLGGFDKVDLSYQEVLKAITSDKSTAEIMGTLLSVSKLKSGTKEYRELAEAIAKVRTEIDVASKTAQDSGLAKFVDKLFKAYELFKDISELNLAPFTTSQLFGIDVASLPMLKQSIETLRDQFVGTDMGKKYQEYLDKVEEMERKAVQDRIKTYAKYLKKAESERMEIMRKSAQDIAEVERLVRDKHFTEEQGRMATAAIQKETKEALAKAEFDAFKDSPLYDLLFQDMTNLPISVLAQLRKELERIKQTAGLTWKQIREINKQINQIDELSLKSGSFADNWNLAREFLRNRTQLYKDLETQTDALIAAQNNEKAIGDELNEKLQERAKLEQDLVSRQVDMSQADAQQWAAYYTLMVAYNQKVQAAANLDKLKETGSDATEEQIAAAQKALDAADTAYDNQLNSYLSKYTEFEPLVAAINQLTKALEKARQNTQNAGNDVEETKKKIDTGIKSLNNVVNNINQWGQAIDKVLQSTDALLNAFGVAEDDSSRLWIQMASQIINVTLQVIALEVQLVAAGKAANAALGWIGFVAIALSGMAAILGSIFGNKDKKLQKKIEDVQRQVDKLSRKLDKLKEALDEAFSIDQMQSYSRQSLANIEQQIEGYERMIALEKDKKDTDWDKITEWENAIDDLRQEYQELQEKAFNDATASILDNTRDAASEFVDAWLEAFTETGEGLSGLEEHFEEMILEMIKQQASLLIAGLYLDKWKKELEKFINVDDLELTTQEAANWAQTVKGDMPQLSEALEAFFKSFESAGIELTPGGEELSGLQKGIEGITEDTAQALEALLNSIRFFVAQDNQNLTNLTQMFTSTDSTVNPMLAQMKIIAKQTSAIYSLLDGLTAKHPTLAGRGLKVII